ALTFNGINQNGNHQHVSLSAPIKEWSEILKTIEHFEDFGVQLQAYTGVSDMHAQDVIALVRDAVNTNQTDIILEQQDFVAINALLEAYADFGFGRLNKDGNPPRVSRERYDELMQNCSGARAQMEAAL
ncbi:MAG: hypothetical protein KAG66_07705, partial [Methylococcales bacterium]|nr:hypothetical protein [Methylococcales bacterium]